MRRHLRISGTALGALLLAGSLAACSPAADEDGAGAATATEAAEAVTGAAEPATGAASSSEPSSEASGGEIAAEHNEADVTFAQQMVPHHEQAVMMSTMAEQRAATDGLRQLAADISAAQGPEIERMRDMLDTWGADPAGPGGMGMDMGGMPGMMDADRMGALDGADDAAFDRMWLEGMIEHHEGAIEMSRAQVRDGLNPQAVELAETIAADQEAEIAVMQDMLAGL